MSSETHERFEEANERDALDGTREDGMGTDGEVSSEFRVKPGAAGEMPEFESDLFDLEMLSPPISSASTKDTDESTASKLLEEAILPAPEGSDGALETSEPISRLGYTGFYNVGFTVWVLH